MKKNIGFSKAYNSIVKQLNEKYVIFLNPDLVFTDGWLTELVKTMESDPMIMIAGAWPVWRKYKDTKIKPYWNSIEDNSAVCGAAMMVRKDKFLEINGFEEEYFLYSEDVDLSYRLNLMGYRIVYNYNAVVFHGKESDDKSFERRICYEIQKNRINVVLKYFRGIHLFTELIRSIYLLCRDIYRNPRYWNDYLTGALSNLKKIQPIIKKRKKYSFSKESYDRFYELVKHDRLKDLRHKKFFKQLEIFSSR